jgi:hypothetical protein
MYRNGLKAAMALAAACLWGQDVVVTGLQAPQKLMLTPGGNFLVSETSREPNSGRVTFVTRSGATRPLFEGLPSGTDTTGGSSGPTAMALRRTTLFIAIGGGDAERPGPRPGTAVPNPAGASSPLFTSVLQVQLSGFIDGITGTFRLTPAQQMTIADGFEVELSDGDGATAKVSRLVDLPDALPDPNTIYRFSNPWGLELTADGRTLYMADSSTNALVSIDTLTGKYRRLVRFAPLPNPTQVGPPVSDTVPTSVRVYGSNLLVSYLSGFPFVPGGAGVYLVNPARRTVTPFIQALSSVTAVLWRNGPNGSRQFFALEFSTNQSADPAPPGRLIRYNDSAVGQVALDGLRAPVSMVLDRQSNELFILELTGRLLKYQVQ